MASLSAIPTSLQGSPQMNSIPTTEIQIDVFFVDVFLTDDSLTVAKSLTDHCLTDTVFLTDDSLTVAMAKSLTDRH